MKRYHWRSVAEPNRPTTRIQLAAVALFAGALAIRLLHVASIRRAPFFSLLMGDSRSYDGWARRIAGGEWIGRDVFYQAPLYPYFLAAVYKLLGRDLLAVRIVQSVIGSASCVLLYLAGRRFVSERAGLIAGALLAVWAPAIFFDALIQKSVLDVFLVCLVLWLLTLRRWLAIGVALGALALTRENALIFVAVIGVFALQQPGRVRNAALLATGVSVVLLPVAARNYAVGGGFYLTTAQFGPNFYIGNNPAADGTYAPLRYGRGAPEYERQDATELAEHATGRTLSPAAVSSYWMDRALDFITGRPAEWLRLVGRKMLLLVNAVEMVDTESQETHAEWSWPLRVLGPFTHAGLLVPLAVLGMFACLRDRKPVGILLALTLTYAASVLLFYVFARYRYPLVPMLAIFASAGLLALPTAIRQRDIVALGTAAVCALAANWPIMPRDWLRAVSEHNIGVALQAEGRYSEALAHYDKAVALRPGYAPALNNKGTALRAAGRVSEALAAYDAAIVSQPDFPDAEYNLANALTDAGRNGDAVVHFQRALAALPASPDAHNNLGIALAAQGKLDEAIAEFRIAVRGDSQSARAHRNLGDALLSKGAIDEGLAEMREAARLAPDDGQLRYDVGSALLEAGQAEAAASELREAVTRLPRSAEARNNLGIALASLGRLDEAIGQFRDALAIAPDFADAKRNLEMAVAARRRSPA